MWNTSEFTSPGKSIGGEKQNFKLQSYFAERDAALQRRTQLTIKQRRELEERRRQEQEEEEKQEAARKKELARRKIEEHERHISPHGRGKWNPASPTQQQQDSLSPRRGGGDLPPMLDKNSLSSSPNKNKPKEVQELEKELAEKTAQLEAKEKENQQLKRQLKDEVEKKARELLIRASAVGDGDGDGDDEKK